MSTNIGHFEIISELCKSATGTVYKANDSQRSQTVALKVIQLSAFGARAGELEQCLVEEAEKTKALNHANLAPVFGAEKIDGQFCGAMEYIQGNSIATMLARKEGFSIWDLLDIGRQVCNGLDHAQSQNVVHYSLEPAKIMCGWDGTVRILGYGLSSVGKFSDQMPELPVILHYMSPEQINGQEGDARSNLFSLGAMFYEMVTDSRAFNGADVESLRQSILECALPAPLLVNPKVHPVLSELIMKALAKDPAQRYQSGREMLDDLERCKESKPKAAKAAPAKGTVVPDAVKAATQAKFAGASAPAPQAKPGVPVIPGKAATAAASGGAKAGSVPSGVPRPQASSPFAGSAMRPGASPTTSMSSAVADEPSVVPQAPAPKIAVDPMMAEGGAQKGGGVSFSEMTELPPLKEIYISPTSAPSSTDQSLAHAPELDISELEPEKPKVQAREAAQKAIKEIKNVPPHLLVYSIAGAAVVILIIAIGLVWHINSLNNNADESPRPVATEAPQPVQSQPVASQPVQPQSAQPQSVQPAPEQPAPVAAAPEQAEAEPAAPEAEEPAPAHSFAAGRKAKKASKRRTSIATGAILVPGQMMIDSVPEGAQVQVDGKSDPSWVTPVTLSGLTPGQHSVSVTKAGFSPDSRTVDVTSGSKSFVQTRLSQLVATLAVSSTPAGASVYIDGKNTGKVTPAQISLNKGQHTVLLRKTGYIDETANAQCNIGQTTNVSSSLRALGDVDDIRTVGKMKKLFGGKEAAGMGMVSVKTQPKGAQVAVNEHMLDKDSPVEFMLDPGNYIIDITLTGYAPIHKVISIDKGDKTVIDEVLQRQ
ncbi:MAG TPA: PEGA domain-containing protein [Candidatus Aquilonibacter sp.]|nr:PEGA domain-containing protein [Candidatus Aquilonibacter sp.]